VAHLNQFGYFVVKDQNNFNKEAIEKIKEGMLSSGQAHSIFESVTERLARGQKKLATKNTFNDRLIQELGRHRVEDNGHCQVIDDVFQQNFKCIVALLKKISKASGRERVWDLGEVTYSRILSNERSTMQQIHLDFEGDWEQFDKIEQLYSLTPLSLFHFPEGGFLTVYPCESATKIPAKIPAPAGKNGCRREASWGRRRKGSRHHPNPVQIFYRNKALRPLVLELEPNQTVVFRGDLQHQGMGYREENLRLFCYIDFPRGIVDREENSTYGVNVANRNKVKIEALEAKNCFVDARSHQFVNNKFSLIGK